MSHHHDEGPRTISVSKDFLRAELTGMELRLVEKLASQADVEALGVRVLKIEESNPPSREEFDALKERNAPSREEYDALKGTLLGLKASVGLVAVVAIAALPMALHHFGL